MVVQFETYGVDGATANIASVDNWATLDRWGNIHLHSSKPVKSECGLFFIGKQDAVRIKIGNQPYNRV